MSEIRFFSEDIAFKPKHQNALITWLNSVVNEHSATITSLNYIFCSDNYLLKINQDFLNHDTYTDVITFPYSQLPDPISSDIFISFDRVISNAKLFEVKTEHELHRVMVHGLLHLLSYDDHQESDKELMRQKEDYFLSLRPDILK